MVMKRQTVLLNPATVAFTDLRFPYLLFITLSLEEHHLLQINIHESVQTPVVIICAKQNYTTKMLICITKP